MRVVGVAMVRNEIDIVEAFVRHSLAIADHLVVLDNGSHDGTLEVLKALQREGLAIELIEDPEPGKRQGERTTKLMRDHALAKHGADWVIPIDADEFLVTGTGGLIPAGMADDRPLRIPWRSYVPEPADDVSERNPVLRIRHRLREEGWPWAKVVVPRGLAALPDARLSEGNHGFFIGETECEPHVSPNCVLGHFPIRSPGQYVAKIAIGYLNRLLVPVRQSDWGFQYRGPFERLKVNPANVAADFREEARRYSWPGGATSTGETVLDPLPYLGGELKHSPTFDDSNWPIAALAAFAETIAARCASYATGMSADDQSMVEHFAAVQTQLYQQLYRKDDALRAAHDALSAAGRHAASTQAELRAALDAAGQTISEYVAAVERTAAAERGARDLLERADEELRAVRGTWAWRVGNAAVGPVRWLRRVIHGAAGANRDRGGARGPTVQDSDLSVDG